jgi:hypothetical protein
MTRGAILFAFNSPKVDYYAMAEYTAKRINHFLNLPVTIVTNKDSVPTFTEYKFDKTVLIDADTNNVFRNDVWINKGRYRAYELSPYDETILIDVDYMVNSDRLLKVFECLVDYNCHDNIAQMMRPDGKNDNMSENSFSLLWATVIAFKKTEKAKQLFDCMRMIQNNYRHYANLYQFDPDIYRNDYALTIAHRILHGQLPNKENIIPWNLMHVWLQTDVKRKNDDEFNTEYVVIYDNWKNNKIKKEYIEIKDMDFHVINKEVFIRLMQ